MLETHLSARFTNVVNASFTIGALAETGKAARAAVSLPSVSRVAPMSTDAIDTAHLSRQTGGDHELERELLALFAQQCAAHLRTIHGSLDMQARLDAAHTLKGAARAVGAWAVAEAADRVERGLSGAGNTVNDAAMDALALATAEARAAIARLDCAD